MKDMDLINTIYDNVQTVRVIRSELCLIARSIDLILGNRELAERLMTMGDDLLASAKAVGTAHSLNQNASYDRQRQQIGETLSALLQRTTPE